MDNYIDFIRYKRIASINDNRKRVEEILKLNNLDGSTLKQEISNLERYKPYDTIFKHNVISFLNLRPKINEDDAELVLIHLKKLGYLKETNHGNVRIV